MLKENYEMKSHRQLSQLLMRGFRIKTDDGEKVFILDLGKNEIIPKKIKEVDSEEDYFDEDVEKLLAKFETDFGEVACRYKDFQKKKNQEIFISNIETEMILNFLDCLVLRNEKIAQEIIKDSYILSLFGQNPSGVLRYYFIDDQSHIFDGFSPNIIINKTSIPFVLPRNGIYACSKDNIDCYVLPLNSFVAILMMPSELFKECCDGNILKHGEITDERVVKDLNNSALFMEKCASNMFIVGDTKELERLSKLNTD